MHAPSRHEISLVLEDWNRGDEEALNRLIPLVYPELKRIARRHLARERRGHSFRTTDLAHETYIRLADQNVINWQNRQHFYAIAACMTRRILVDHARSKMCDKRGGGAIHLGLDEAGDIPVENATELIDLDNALTELSRIDKRKALIVAYKFYCGLGIEEIAECLNISKRTVQREWRFSQAWLLRELRNESRIDKQRIS